jgi:hypothetical protein
MTAPQIPQMQQQNIWGAYLAFPPIYMWPFGMQTLVRCATCHKHTAHSFVLIPQFAGKFKIKKKKKNPLFRGNDGVCKE